MTEYDPDFNRYDYPGSNPNEPVYGPPQNVNGYPPFYDASSYGPMEPVKQPKGESKSLSWPAGIVLVAVSSIVASALTVGAMGFQDNNVQTTERTVTIANATPASEATVADALQSVFTIAVVKGDSQGTGSGVAIDDKHIVTNAHVVTLGGSIDKNAKVEVQDSNGVEMQAEVVGIDQTADLAVLKISGSKLEPLAWASEELAVGEPVLALGAPLRLADTVTSGIVSAVNRPVALGQNEDGSSNDSSTFINTVQTDAAINSGNSGGALVNGKGDLAGINVAISSSGSGTGNIGIGYAIPATYAQRIVAELIKTGTATHGYLGVSATTAASKGGNFQDGALLQEVVKGSPADDAGLRANDVIVSFNGMEIPSSEALTASAKATPPNTASSVIIRRNNREMTLDVKLGQAE